MENYKSGLRPGPLNLLTDVAGLRVGNANDMSVLSGVTVVLPDEPVAAGVHVGGGAPGTRDTEALVPDCLVEHFHGFVLAGGSVYGLDAAGGVVSWLGAQGVGFKYGKQPLACPVVPAANLFDLINGGNKDWGDLPPYRALGIKACKAAGRHFSIGNHGAGLGAMAGGFKGGLGSASAIWNGYTIGALCAVNPYGSPVNPQTGDLWARPFELAGEFGSHTIAPGNECDLISHTKAEFVAGTGENTTLCLVAVDVQLSKAQCQRVANMARDGLARALRPVHTPYDGDIVFAVATGKKPLKAPQAFHLSMLGAVAGDVLARAIGRGIVEARTTGTLKAFCDVQ